MTKIDEDIAHIEYDGFDQSEAPAGMLTTHKRLRASVLIQKDNKILAVRLRDPVSKELAVFLPGGKVEVGETPAGAAMRECYEETGYPITVDESSEHVCRYLFIWAGEPVDCTTHFFRGTLTDPTASPCPTNEPSYHEGVDWIPMGALKHHFGFHSVIWSAVVHLTKGRATPKSFQEFWPFYLNAHRLPATRMWHLVGTLGALALFVAASLARSPALFLLAPALGYTCSWIGHYTCEKNRPATFSHPLWSLRGDLQMFWLTIRRKLAAEMKAVCDHSSTDQIKSTMPK